MCNYARCINCGSEDVEATGEIRQDLDEYYCHNCEKYFTIDWDKQDEIEESENEEEY